MSNDASRKESFEAYRDYAKDLRTWLLAFGIGAPALFISDKFLSLQSLAAKKDEIRFIAILFLAGVVLQVILALTNKYWNYYYYDKKCNDSNYTGDFPDWAIWIDRICDFGAAALFCWGSFRMYSLFI